MNDKINTFSKELNYIRNERIKENLKIVINLLPDYFFRVEASTTGKYHPSFALDDGGLVRHTKVVVKIGRELLENNSLGHKFTNDEKDLLLFSLLIHDGLKCGVEKEKYTRFDHPILIANYIKDNKDKLTLTDEEINFISDCVSSHMGEWNTNQYSDVVLPLPKTKYQRFVHMCDYLGSRKFLDVTFENNDIVE